MANELGGITINLFKNRHGDGPWLYVWHGVDMTKYFKPGEALPPDGIPIAPEDEERMNLAIQLERTLREEFVRAATTDYALAVEWVRYVVAELDTAIEITIFDRGLEQ